MQPKNNLRISDVTDSTFFVEGRSTSFRGSAADPFLFASKQGNLMSSFLMALNVGTMGHFEWAHKDPGPSAFTLFNYDAKSATPLHVKHEYKIDDGKRQPLNPATIWRAARVLMALSNENQSHVRHEYLKGIFHLGHSYYDLTFEKDAFANFYRCFEYFVTRRHLNVRNLGNECKAIEKCLAGLGWDPNMIDLFKKQYKLRGTQVMHAQEEQRDITWNDVFLMKLLADAVIQAHYKPIWEAYESAF